MIIGSIFAAYLQIFTDAAVDTFSLSHAIIYGATSHGVLVPYRASVPVYGLVGLYRSPGSVTRTCNCTHLVYARHEDGTTRTFGGGSGTANLGDKSGLWSLYSASVTYLITDGPSHTETWGLTIAGVLTNYTVEVMGLTLTIPATTFAGPHGVSTQRAWSVSGALCASRHPLLQPQAHAAYTTPPNGEFAVYSGSNDADGVGSASGTIRADSAGLSNYPFYGVTIGMQVRFNCGGVYDPTAGSLDETVHPMAAIVRFSLLPA